MNQELLETWMNEADREYVRATQDENVAVPRDMYVALFMEQKMRTYRIERERETRYLELEREEQHDNS